MTFAVTLFCAWAFLPYPVWSQTSETQSYLQALEKSKNLDLEKQVDVWREWLSENPNSQFRPEVEKNLQNLEELLLNSNPEKKKESQDTEIYLRAVEFSKTLSERDRIDLWYQFLEENPDNLFRPEVERILESLERRHAPSRPQIQPTTAKPQTEPQEPLVLDLKYKDPDRALLYATFVGLLVPGMGHWYAEDYVIAGALTALRIAGLAIGIPAIVKKTPSLIITGGVLVGFSYIVDVADTPFAVARYNEALERQQADVWNAPELMLTFHF